MESVIPSLKSFDLLSLFWIISSILIACAHVILCLDINPKFNVIERVLEILKPFYYFGKLKKVQVKHDACNKSKVLTKLTSSLLSFPKSWFSHFYVAGVFVHSAIFLLLILLANKVTTLPGMLREISLFLHWSESGTKDQVQSLLLVVTVFACEEVHLLRRIYECYFISSFSSGTISIIHYFYGVAFYVMFGFGILISLPLHNLRFSIVPGASDVFCCSVGIMTFCAASYFQNKTMKTFADLRLKEKDKSARGHYIPNGHLFHWVSSPHYLCEILIYMSLCLITQWKNQYLVCATVFVLVNQASASLSVHNWYRSTFKNYPKHRKALVPYLL